MNLFNFLNDFVTLIVAIVVCFIVYRQYRNDIQANRMNLFDKRYKIYHQTKELLLHLTEHPINTKEMFDYKEAFFLFEKPDVYNYLHNEVLPRMIKYKTAGLKEGNELFLWFRNEYETIEGRFIKYLDFRKAEPEPFGHRIIKVFQQFVCICSTYWNKVFRNKNVPAQQSNA